jgi:hypothetical protein
MARRMADRVERSEPPRGPLQLHHLDAKTEISCVRAPTEPGLRVPTLPSALVSATLITKKGSWPSRHSGEIGSPPVTE